LALQREEFNDANALREIKRLTRVAIAVCLEGRPLRTRELWLRKCKINSGGRIGP
jgi:hypothetical protein